MGSIGAILMAVAGNIFTLGFVGVVKDTLTTITKVILGNIGNIFGLLFGAAKYGLG